MAKIRLTAYFCLSVLFYSMTPKMAVKKHTYLALGDSYTIGESVPARENFPSLTVQQLNNTGLSFDKAEIIAKTGWTTDELQNAIDKAKPESSFDIVSLLIGVNNQYRGRPVEEYAGQFEVLLKQAIVFAGNEPSRVFVLSIPDWGITPFAEGRNRKAISREIDAYNEVNRSIAQKYNVHYIDITPGTREAAGDKSLLAGDGLHPSGKEYARWAEKLALQIGTLIY